VEANKFNEVRQVAYVLGAEERRSYSTNRVTKITKVIRRSN